MSQAPVKLSVVIPNYNHSRYISEALSAIIDQSFKPYEIVVVDDASTDNSVEVVEGIANAFPIVRLVRNKQNMGVANSVNCGLKYISGDYIYVTSADDKILPGFFEKSMRLLMQYPQAAICSGLTFIINEQGKREGFLLNPIVSLKAGFFPPERARDMHSKQGCWISGTSSIMRLDYFRENGGYWPQLHAYSDGFLEQLLALKYGACFIPEPLACWRRIKGNYCRKISEDRETFAKVIETATSLMRTRYQDVFPEPYVELWRRQNLFYLNYYIHKNLLEERLRNAAAVGKPSLAQSLWFRVVKQYLLLRNHITVCYLYFAFKNNPWRMLNNRIRHFFIKKRYLTRTEI